MFVAARSIRPGLTFFALGLLAPLAAQVVSISAPDPDAAEAGSYPALFRVERAGDLSSPLVVNLAWGGTATPGADYEPEPSSVVVPAGAAFVELSLDPINDAVAEANASETVVATVQPGPGYTVGAPASATVTIAEDETLALTAPLLYLATPDSATSVVLRWVDLFETETKFRVQFRLAGATAWTTRDNIAPNTTSFTVTGLVTGQPYEFRVDAYQGSTASKTINPVIAVPLPPDSSAPAYATFEQWRGARGLGGALRPVSGGSAADPDADGRPNFLEYALGGDPLAPDRADLQIASAPGWLQLSWPHVPGLLDVTVRLRESVDLATWGDSPLAVTTSAAARAATDTRSAPRRFYRLEAAPAGPVAPAALITCWGDSLTGNPGTYAEKLSALLPGRSTQNCGIGGDTSIQIADRLRGLQITSPYPAYAASTPAGSTVRVVASRTTHARIMNPSLRGNWATWSATIANASRVEFFNRGVKIGESSAPLSASVTSNRAVSASRILAAGHPFSAGDVVHFPAGPLPSPLVVGKPYYVRDADAGGFRLVEGDVSAVVTASSSAPSTRFVSASHPYANGDAVWFRRGATPPGYFADRFYFVRDADTGGFALADTAGGPAISMIYNFTGAVMGKPGLTPVSLAADFAAPTAIRGPFVLDWTHPGGATALSLRTHTDRDANTFIFWMGRNNNARPHEVYADLLAAIEQIKALDARFLIVSVTNGGGESLGNPYYYGTVNLNHFLRRQFPANFVDIRSALIRAAGASTADQTDRAADIPPSSLRSDNVHFNDAGQTLIANLLAAELARRGW